MRSPPGAAAEFAELLKQGRNEITLYTDMSNPTSNKIYIDLGYKFVCNSLHLGVIESPNL